MCWPVRHFAPCSNCSLVPAVGVSVIVVHRCRGSLVGKHDIAKLPDSLSDEMLFMLAHGGLMRISLVVHPRAVRHGISSNCETQGQMRNAESHWLGCFTWSATFTSRCIRFSYSVGNIPMVIVAEMRCAFAPP